MSKQAIQWYAVRVTQEAQRKRKFNNTQPPEFVGKMILERRGFNVFLPTKKVYRRKNKYSREKHLVKFPLMVGWMFVGWPADQDKWHELFKLRMVSSVAGVQGRPFQIPQSVMNDLFKRFGYRAPDQERFMRTHHEFKVGDDVRVIGGPFDGQVVQVTELEGPKARVLMEFFGSQRLLEFDTWGLEDVA